MFKRHKGVTKTHSWEKTAMLPTIEPEKTQPGTYLLQKADRRPPIFIKTKLSTTYVEVLRFL
jgi:hypothetical protein